MGFIFQQMYMMKNLTILDNIILLAVQSKKNSESRKETVKVAARCTRTLYIVYIVDGNIKGEYNLDRCESPAQMRERERTLNNWLMEMGW